MTLRPASAFVFPCLLIAGGCTEKPKAPPLVNDTVYQNDKIGLRFLAPEGWSVSSRAELPADALPKPIIVIAYHFNKGGTHSELEVLAADLSENAELGKFLAEHRIGAVAWTLKPPPESVTINGSRRDSLCDVARRGQDRNPARGDGVSSRRPRLLLHHHLPAHRPRRPRRRSPERSERDVDGDVIVTRRVELIEGGNMTASGEIPEDRPLTVQETSLIRWLLSNGTPAAAAYLPQVAEAHVVSRCPCGCASVDFTVGGVRAPLGEPITILADYEYQTASGHLCGVFVFARTGLLAGLEVWSIDGQCTASTLPLVEELKPIEH